MNDYGRKSSVTAMLKDIQLPSLQERRLNQRLVMMHKIIHNNVDLHLDDHLEFNTRDSAASSTRHHNPLSLKIPSSKTNCHQKSFIPNTARDWNKLPYSTTSIADSTIFQNLTRTMKNMTNSLCLSNLTLSDVPVGADQLYIHIHIHIRSVKPCRSKYTGLLIAITASKL